MSTTKKILNYYDLSKDKDNIHLSKVIGSGGFGEVHLGMYRGRRVAVKIGIGSQSFKAMENEIEILSKVNGHPNIAEFIGYVIAGKVLKNVRSLMIIMDYYNCSNLYFPLQIISRYTESNTRYYMRQLCNALAYLHSANIVHGDLKLENLVIQCHSDGEQTLKLIDFGTAT